jgi:hypothetical protein
MSALLSSADKGSALSVRAPNYELRCESCRETFGPVICTKRNELLQPDYDELDLVVGVVLRTELERFHDKHDGHSLTEVEV